MTSTLLRDAVLLSSAKIFGQDLLRDQITGDSPVLLLLAAGKGTRYGTDPKCIAPVLGRPLSSHSIDAFRSQVPGSVSIAVIGYRHEEVSNALGTGNLYILSDNPAGGTAQAVFEAFSLPELLEENPIIVISMGDRVVPPAVFQRLLAVHRGKLPGTEELSGNSSDTAVSPGGTEADLTMLTARYDTPRLKGKGRIIRSDAGRIIRIMEERDILLLSDSDQPVKSALLSLNEGNCPLYAVRAAKLFRSLKTLSNDNAQNQYYLTDIIERIASSGGEIRSVTISPLDSEFEVLCADVTRPADLPKLEAVLSKQNQDETEIQQAAAQIAAGRPEGQTASIRRQIGELLAAVRQNHWSFDENQPVSIGISGGRFRIAFMHPDMGRFYGPAWQVPIGAEEESGTEQITILMQETDDGRLHLYPLAEQFRESVDFIAADGDEMYPDRDISDWYRYEEFGTKMSRRILLSLGYFSNEELDRRRELGLPLPPESLWAETNRRRPFSLVSNAIASLRTYRTGEAGKRIEDRIGKGRFGGLILTSTGLMPQGGFSCSSALTIAVKNALNALYDFSLSGEELIHLAAQAEYGTGVRAGALDQATVQKGKAGIGTLVSSNPRDHYAVLGTYPIPDRITVLFPYTASRDMGATRYSAGFYAASQTADGTLTASETRKLTGKGAEIAALYLEQPLDVDFFDEIRDDLIDDGLLTESNRRLCADKLRRLPLLIDREELRRMINGKCGFFAEELVRCRNISPEAARRQAQETIDSLFTGWRNPVYRYPDGTRRSGVPLRAIVGYLYAEVAKNFYLIHHTDEWTACVANSQRGDRCFEIDPARLPEADQLLSLFDFEQGASGPDRVDLWLEKLGAHPFDFNADLDDESLSANPAPVFHRLRGGNFFRGLAVIDLVEAFLIRAFHGAVSVRVNAAGQGDFFQVHVDTSRTDTEQVKEFLRRAYYDRFEIQTETPFIEVHTGGGAVGVRLSRFALLEQLYQVLTK